MLDDYVVSACNLLLLALLGQPSLKLHPNHPLLQTHPDATMPEGRPWLVVNVQNSDITTGDTLIESVGVGPPDDSKMHRYIVLVFEQKGKIDTSGVQVVKMCQKDGRFGTKTNQLINDYDLGDPVFGNFFLTKYDDSVAQLYAAFSC